MTVGSPGVHRRGRARLLIVGGLVLLIAAGVAAYRSRPQPSVGASAVAALASATPAPPETSGRPARRGDASDPAAAADPFAAADPAAAPDPAAGADPAAVAAADPAAVDQVAPVRLRIPALGLDASVAAVGVDAETGDFDVPPSVDRVGWYRFGPGLTARAGSIVVAGHVDSADQGKGAFFRLGSLAPGDTITVAGASGEQRVFDVIARERYRKTRIPLARYFARDGAPRLTLITCGGPFDSATRHYRDNIVVTAQPQP